MATDPVLVTGPHYRVVDGRRNGVAPLEDRLPWVPFSERYGFRKRMTGDPLWWSRHTAEAVADGERDARFRCACPGSNPPAGCAERATQEDGLCDKCRGYCWGVTVAGDHVRLINAFGPGRREQPETSTIGRER